MNTPFSFLHPVSSDGASPLLSLQDLLLSEGSVTSFKVHKYCDKRSLSICGHKCDHLILDHLDTAVYLFFDSELCDFIYLFFVKLKTNAFKFIFTCLRNLRRLTCTNGARIVQEIYSVRHTASLLSVRLPVLLCYMQ